MQPIESSTRRGRAAHLVARSAARTTWQRLRDGASDTFSAEQADGLRAAFRADIAASGSAWWVDPVDAALLAAVEIAVDAECAALVAAGETASAAALVAEHLTRCELRVDAGARRAIAELETITCEAAAALVVGGELRLLPRAAQPRLRRAYWNLLPVDDANATFYADLADRVLPLAGCTTFAKLLQKVEAERGSLQGDDRYLLVRRGFDPAALPIECRYLICDGALVVVGADGLGGEQVWAAEPL
jgi:hypothetical protein